MAFREYNMMYREVWRNKEERGKMLFYFNIKKIKWGNR